MYLSTFTLFSLSQRLSLFYYTLHLALHQCVHIPRVEGCSADTLYVIEDVRPMGNAKTTIIDTTRYYQYHHHTKYYNYLTIMPIINELDPLVNAAITRTQMYTRQYQVQKNMISFLPQILSSEVAQNSTLQTRHRSYQ